MDHRFAGFQQRRGLVSLQNPAQAVPSLGRIERAHTMFSSAPDRRETPQSPHRLPLPGRGQALSRLPSVLLATTHGDIRRGMGELFQVCGINVLLATGMKEVKSTLEREHVAACFCGFWLVDGTYRDVVRHLRRERYEIPVIIVCEPGCPDEYRDYLAALNIRAFDFICHPYRQTDLEKILHSTIALHNQPAAMRTSSGASSDGDFVSANPLRAS